MNEAFWFSILASVALKSSMVLGVACVAALILRRGSAAMRHLLWTAALTAVLVLPLFSISLPAWRVPSMGTLAPGVAALFETTAVSGTDAATAKLPTAAAPAKPAPRRPDWRLTLMLLWSAGVVASLAQLLVACVALWRVRRSARPSPDRQIALQLARELGIRHAVPVLETSDGSMPMTCGFLRPAILMPRDAARWSEERRRIVLLHELAHVRRCDVATHILARCGVVLNWWNPLAWIAWREFLKERERATDDLVLNSGARASDYAGHLLDVARGMQSSPALASAAVAMARRSQLEGRLIAILDSRVNRKTAGRASALAAVVAAVAMVAPFAAVRAQDQATSPKPARPATPASGSGGQRADDGGALAQLRDPEKRPNPPQGAVVFKSQARDNPPESANELMHLGVIALRDKNYPQAIDFFQRSQGLDPKLAGRTQMWMALANERESNTPDADALYRSALALADPDSKDAATVMELYARFLKDQGRSEEAKPMSDRATELRKSPAPVTTAMRIGAGVSPPRIVSKVDPEYTDEARAAKYEGTVVLFVELDPDGIARNIQVVKSLGLGLDDKAIAAVSQWRFNPAQKNGEPVTVQATIEVNFRLL